MPAMGALANPPCEFGRNCQLLSTAGALDLKWSSLSWRRRDRRCCRRRRERNVDAAGAGSAGRGHCQSLAAVDAIALLAGEIVWHKQRLLAAGTFNLNRHEFTSSRGRVRTDAFSARHGPLVANATQLKSGLRAGANPPRHLVYTAVALCKTGERVDGSRRVDQPYILPLCASWKPSRDSWTNHHRPRRLGYLGFIVRSRK
jgi:hypothetical protein